MSSEHIDFDGHEWSVNYFGKRQDDFRLTLGKSGAEAITINVIPPDQFIRLHELLSAALEERADHLADERAELEQQVWLLREAKDDLEGELKDLKRFVANAEGGLPSNGPDQ